MFNLIISEIVLFTMKFLRILKYGDNHCDFPRGRYINYYEILPKVFDLGTVFSWNVFWEILIQLKACPCRFHLF